MKDSFLDKVFLVTGASSGIGLELARLLCKRGARAGVMARTESKLEDLARESGESLLALPGDVSCDEDCRRAVERTVEKFGRLDGLIHNAGITMRALSQDTVIEVHRRLMEVNYFSMIFLYRSALPHIVKSRGHLVAISSMMGLYSTQLRSGYAASKHALQGFLDSVRLEHASDGIHVMVVNPGFVKTNVSVNALAADGSLHGKMDAETAKGLPPERVAQAVLDGIARRKRAIFVAGFQEKLGLFLSKWAPGTLDRILLKKNVT